VSTTDNFTLCLTANMSQSTIHGNLKTFGNWLIGIFAFLTPHRETTGMPPYYVDEDYPAGPEINEPLPE